VRTGRFFTPPLRRSSIIRHSPFRDCPRRRRYSYYPVTTYPPPSFFCTFASSSVFSILNFLRLPVRTWLFLSIMPASFSSSLSYRIGKRIISLPPRLDATQPLPSFRGPSAAPIPPLVTQFLSCFHFGPVCFYLPPLLALPDPRPFPSAPKDLKNGVLFPGLFCRVFDLSSPSFF